MDPVLTGLLGIVVLLLLFSLNMPVAFAMAFVGFAGFGYLVSWDAAMSLLIRDIFTQLSSYPLNVIVLFVLMGSFAFASGPGRGHHPGVQWFCSDLWFDSRHRGHDRAGGTARNAAFRL